MLDAFIAYAPADKGFARLLDEVLSRRGVTTWARWDTAPPDHNGWLEIQAAIEAADNILYIITPEAAESPLVREQIQYAARHHKRFVPILRHDLPSGSVNKAVRRYPLVHALSSEPFDKALNQIITSINRDRAYVHMHTALLLRSREWMTSGRKRRYLLRGKKLHAAEKWYVQSSMTAPQPIECQLEYIFASRRAREDGQRQSLWVVMVAFVATFIFAGVTFSRLLNAPHVTQMAAAAATSTAIPTASQAAAEETQTRLIATASEPTTARSVETAEATAQSELHTHQPTATARPAEPAEAIAQSELRTRQPTATARPAEPAEMTATATAPPPPTPDVQSVIQDTSRSITSPVCGTSPLNRHITGFRDLSYLCYRWYSAQMAACWHLARSTARLACGMSLPVRSLSLSARRD